MSSSPYADRTLGQKWGIKAGMRVWLGSGPAGLRKTVRQWLQGTRRSRTGPVDLGFVFPRSVTDWSASARKLRGRLAPQGVIWVVFPKKDAAKRLGFNASFAQIIAAVAGLGLVDNKTCAVNEDYTSKRFSIRRELRPR